MAKKRVHVYTIITAPFSNQQNNCVMETQKLSRIFFTMQGERCAIKQSFRGKLSFEYQNTKTKSITIISTSAMSFEISTVVP